MLKSKLSLSRHFEYANKQITYHFWLPSYKDALSNDNSVLNATASTFVSHETRDKFITSTPMQTTNQSKDIIARNDR
jgi:hypothetical protein